MTGVLWQSSRLLVSAYSDNDLVPTLQVYQACEDFLSLGPVAVASTSMVLADIAHSREQSGSFCIVSFADGAQIGVLDFVERIRPKTALLLLLMIGKAYRHHGYGQELICSFEDYLRQNWQIEIIESGVQTNNEEGIGFWKKCGFKIGSVPRDMGDGTIAYEMSKRI
jgi:RimJ/RimL family protein N-acetyltransferase